MLTNADTPVKLLILRCYWSIKNQLIDLFLELQQAFLSGFSTVLNRETKTKIKQQHQQNSTEPEVLIKGQLSPKLKNYFDSIGQLG